MPDDSPQIMDPDLSCLVTRPFQSNSLKVFLTKISEALTHSSFAPRVPPKQACNLTGTRCVHKQMMDVKGTSLYKEQGKKLLEK